MMIENYAILVQIYIVLSIMFMIGVVISSACICFHWYLKKVILILMLVLIPKQ